jgi:predicted kinase
MNAVIFIGVQGSGKSTFCKNTFYDTHIRINMDMLRTKHRENLLISACFEAKQNFVVDKTNPTVEERSKYISQAKSHKFRIIGYYFQSKLEDALQRNSQREGKAKVDERGVRGVYSKLELPTFAEGFDELYYVWINEKKEFIVEKWKDEI